MYYMYCTQLICLTYNINSRIVPQLGGRLVAFSYWGCEVTLRIVCTSHKTTKSTSLSYKFSTTIQTNNIIMKHTVFRILFNHRFYYISSYYFADTICKIFYSLSVLYPIFRNVYNVIFNNYRSFKSKSKQNRRITSRHPPTNFSQFILLWNGFSVSIPTIAFCLNSLSNL